MNAPDRNRTTKLSLGAAIRERRLALGLSQEQLAERISAAGDRVRQSDVSRLELDRIGRPRASRLQAIAQALQLTSVELLARAGLVPFERGHELGVVSFHVYQRRLEAELRRVQKNHQPLALLLVRVRLTGPLRERSHGTLLHELVVVLRTGMRVTDVITQYADTTFMILLPDTTHTAAAHIRERLYHALPSVGRDLAIPIQVSIGLASYPDDGASTPELLQSILVSDVHRPRLSVAESDGRDQADEPTPARASALRRLPQMME